jgi:hypothetical protein
VSTLNVEVRTRLWPVVRALALCVVLSGLAGLAGCGDDEPTLTIPPLTPEYDASVSDAAVIPDGAVLCEGDDACDDGVDCTRDLCVQGGYCVNSGDASRCNDGVFCNGAEYCNEQQGCEATPPPTCDDGDLCTIDRCDEDKKVCDHRPRDFDGDGEADWHCAGGTDCDDFDPTRGTQTLEACEDGIDNDCDDAFDEADCGTLEHDTCGDALEVSAGGSFSIDARGARPDYALSCGEELGRDVAFVLELEEPADVVLRARGVRSNGDQEIATLAVRGDCDDMDSELKCRRGFPAELRIRALPEGRYFLLAHSQSAASIVLDVAFDAPSEAPTNDACEDPVELGQTDRVTSNFVETTDDEALVCGFAGAADLVYAIDIDETSDLELSAISTSGERMSMEVRRSCDNPESTLRCISDAPAQGRLRSVEPGRYFIVVEGPASRDVDFSLDVAVLPPTDSPAGEGCAQAVDLPLGETIDGTLAGRQDLIDVRCGCASCGLFMRETVFRIVVDERTDVGLTIEGGDARMHYALRSECSDGATQRSCSDGVPLFERVRNLEAGEYFVIVESAQTAPFTIKTERLPPTQPVEVVDNGVCAAATSVPTAGGVFVGDTTRTNSDYEAGCGGGAASSDAAFRVELTEEATVRAFLTADFDAVLYRIEDFGDGGQSCSTVIEAACDDDGGGGTNSLLEERLPAGAFYYIVDGYGFGNQGSYVLDISIE